MIVCVCNTITEKTIVETIEKYNVKTIEELQKRISVCNNCHTCERYILNLIEKHSKKA